MSLIAASMAIALASIIAPPALADRTSAQQGLKQQMMRYMSIRGQVAVQIRDFIPEHATEDLVFMTSHANNNLHQLVQQF